MTEDVLVGGEDVEPVCRVETAANDTVGGVDRYTRASAVTTIDGSSARIQGKPGGGFDRCCSDAPLLQLEGHAVGHEVLQEVISSSVSA